MVEFICSVPSEGANTHRASLLSETEKTFSTGTQEVIPNE